MKRRKNKKRNTGRIDITGARIEREGLPPMGREYLATWKASHPGEEIEAASSLDLFIHSGTCDRMAMLAKLLMCVCDVCDFMLNDFRDLCVGWNWWKPGVQPAIDGAIKRLKPLNDILHTLSFHSGDESSEERKQAQLRYSDDYDRLLALVYEFGGMPVHWRMGEPVELKRAEPAVDENPSTQDGKLAITMPAGGSCTIRGTTQPDHQGRLISRYSIYFLNTALGNGHFVRQGIHTLRGARRIAIRLTRDNPDNMYIIYRDEHLAVGNHHLTPIDYVHRNHLTK